MAKRIQFGNNYIDIPELPNHIGLIIVNKNEIKTNLFHLIHFIN